MTTPKKYSASLTVQDWDLIMEALQDYVCKCLEAKITVLTEMEGTTEQESHLKAFDALIVLAKDTKTNLRKQLAVEMRKGRG